MFYNRLEAGLLLAEKLKKYKNDTGIILAVPRGGVPIAYSVARELDIPFEVIFTKKIEHPTNKEYAIGVASFTDYFIMPGQKVSKEYLKEALRKVRTTLKEMYIRFMGKEEPGNLKGKTVIVIDDGIATGNTLMATIRLLRKKGPAKIVIGTPVASRRAVNLLSKETDEIITVLIPEAFHSVNAFYDDFKQVTDKEVLFYLNKLRSLETHSI